MNHSIKFILAVIIIFSKNLFAANFTVSSPSNNTIDAYNLAVFDNPFIDNIIFEANDTLSVNNSNSRLISITTQYDGQGKLDFTTSSELTITEGGVGTFNNQLSEVISDDSNITINATSLYAKALNLTNSTSDITISGSSILNFNNINLSNSDADLIFSNDSQQVNISGDVISSGTGEIKGANSNLTFSGSDDQTIGSTLGSGVRISSLNISGSNTKNFDKNIKVSNIIFSNSGDATINLSGNNELDLTGDIASSATSGVIARITGSNASNVLRLSGASDQTLNAIFGTSADSRFNKINIINNISNINFSQDSYVNIMNIDGANATLNSSALMDISTLNISQDVTLSGSSAMNIANFNVDTDGKEVTLNRDISISGHITGLEGGNTEEISGISGTILFNGSSTQDVNYLTLGKVSTIRLGTLKTSNIDDIGVNFKDNVYVNDVIFDNSSGLANLNIFALQEFDIGGNITKSTANALIKGGGTVKLSGTDTQNINVNLGTSDNRLEALNITNSTGVILRNNIYVNNFYYNGNNLTLVSNSNLDISEDMDLTNKNINFRLSSDNSVSNPFGQINIGANITTLDSNIFFDYSSLTGNALNFDYNGGSYNIINNSNVVNLDNISVSDNSYLFNHSLTLDGNNIQTTINKDSNIFNKEILGDINVKMLDHALSKSNIASDIMSITTEYELENAMESIRLPNNSPLLKYNISTHNNLNHFTTQRIRNITLLPKRNRQGLWAEFYTSNIVQGEDKKEGYDGFIASGTGFLAGYDYVNGGNVIGFGGFYSGAKVENDNKGDFTSIIESSGFTLYNKFGSKYNKGFYNINNFHYIGNNYLNERTVKLPNINEIIKAELSGSSMSFRSEIGYNINFIKSSIFSPKISLEYFSDERDSYKEEGSENSAFKVKEEEYDNFIFSAGFDFGGKFYTSKKTLFSPVLDISWRKYLGDDKQKRIMSYNNNEYFSINSAELPSDYLNIAFNAEYSRSVDDFHVNPVFNIKYNAMLTEEFISHAFTAEIRYNFNSRLMGIKRK